MLSGINHYLFINFSFACPKEKLQKKKTAWVFGDPPSVRFLSQSSRSSSYYPFGKKII